MKVKVRVITPPYDDVPTESLQAILRNHAHDKLQIQIGTKQLFDIMGELTRRRDASGMPSRSTEEAWAEFVKHYLPEAEPSEEALLQALQTPHELTPSPGGRECLGNGNWPGYACQCPDCDWYATICFPDWEKQGQ